MAGNSRRRGATRRTARKPAAGSGGRGRKALAGRGPTPKAEDRPYHVAAKRQAARKRPERKSREGEIVAGRNAVVEALRAEVPCSGVWIGHRVEVDERIRLIRTLAAERGLPLLEVTTAELNRLAGNLAHQGVVIGVPEYGYVDLAQIRQQADDAAEVPLIVALDGVTDPRNLGAIIRSVGAFGGHGVVIPQRRAAGVSAAAWKASAGAAARVPVARVTNLVRALGELRDAGCFVVGLDAGGEDLASLDLLAEPLVLVVGSEGRGLGRLVRESCDAVAGIPIRGVESLNASVAAGVGLYQVARTRLSL